MDTVGKNESDQRLIESKEFEDMEFPDFERDEDFNE